MIWTGHALLQLLLEMSIGNPNSLLKHRYAVSLGSVCENVSVLYI